MNNLFFKLVNVFSVYFVDYLLVLIRMCIHIRVLQYDIYTLHLHAATHQGFGAKRASWHVGLGYVW